MKITKALRDHLVKNFGLLPTASDDEVRAAVTKHLLDGKLDSGTVNTLLKETHTDTIGGIIAAQLDGALAPLKGVLEGLSAKLGAPGGTNTAAQGAGNSGAAAGGTGQKAPELTDDEKKFAATMEKLGYKKADGVTIQDSVDPHRVVFKSNNGTASVRVVGAAEKYSKGRSAILFPAKSLHGRPHPKAGQQATYCGENLETPSQLGKAVTAAYFKWSLACSSRPEDIPRGLRMTDHDRDLVNYAIHEMPWSGVIKTSDDGYQWEHKVARRKLTEFEIKALLDDGTSGGIEIAPIEFDDALVTTPVLFGELFPLVNVVDVSRGRRMKGGAVGNPTFAASTEGTAITAFDTSAFVSAFDTTIYVAAAAMEVGMDFEEDSPTNIGQLIMDKYSEKAMEWLDRVIAVGDGTTEPQGIFNASGTTAVASDNGTSGPATVGDYEGLMFGVAKQFRNSKGGRNVFIANETSYRRCRAIPVGPSDERRVFGMSHADFTVLDTPYKINNAAALTNSMIAYANMGYYRMYRRLGFNVRIVNEGNYAVTRNQRVIVVRMRYGGKIELGGAVAVSTDAQS